MIKFSNGVNLYNQLIIMKQKKKKKIVKAVKRVKVLKPVKNRKILVRPFKSGKAGISAKPKLFNGAKKIISRKVNKRKAKVVKRVVRKKPVTPKKAKKKIKPTKKIFKRKPVKLLSREKVKVAVSKKKKAKKIIKKTAVKKRSVGKITKKPTKRNPTKVQKRILTRFAKASARRAGPSQSRQKASLVGKPVKKNVHRLIKPVAKKKKTVLHKIKKTTAKIKEDDFSPQSLFKAKIKVIGIGGGGGSIVSEFGRSLQKASFVIADTDVRALRKKPGIKDFWFGEEFTRGLGTGVDVDLAKRAAESVKEKIEPIFKEQDIIIFVASLGGGLGSGATQVFAEVARNLGGITMGIFTMPFKFEGKNKYRIAQSALKNLKGLLNVSLVIPNERIFKIIDESTPILSAFSTVNKTLIESLESLIELIYNPGIINIDFADLRSILKGRGSSAFLNTVEESGNNRAEKICGSIFNNPLLQNNGIDAEKILFNIEGSDKLSMFEVEKISSHISEANPNAKIIFGISKNQKLKNKIRTTILMTGGQIKETVRPKKQEKPKEVGKIITGQKEKNAVEKIVAAKPVENRKAVALPKKVKKRKPRKKSPDDKKEPNVPEKKPAFEEEKLVPFIPVPAAPANVMPIIEPRRIDILETQQVSTKKAIRRSGLEIKKAEELAEKKRAAQEKEWEIPAFLRKVKFKS